MRSFARRATTAKEEPARPPAPKVLRRPGVSPSLRRAGLRFEFFRSIAGELRKVTWPTRLEIQRLTWLVVGVSVCTGLALGGIDLIFTRLVSFIIDYGR
jgi:preprotein translocase subunit SecE